MSGNFLPSLQESLALLRERGEIFPSPRDVTALEGLTFDHPRKGQVGIEIDEAVLRAQGQVYVGDPVLREALQTHEIPTASLKDAMGLMSGFGANEVIWGFSGYASEGPKYDIEVEGLTRLYDYLAEIGKKPKATVDGAVSAGNPGINAVIAAENGVDRRIGMICKQGLGSVGIRDHLIIWGDTYQDREVLVGSTPDILVCIDGAGGTWRECQWALNCGTPILLLALKKDEDYRDDALPKTYHTLGGVQEALDNETMVVCRKLEDIPASVDTLLQKIDTRKRPARLAQLGQLLVDTTVA